MTELIIIIISIYKCVKCIANCKISVCLHDARLQYKNTCDQVFLTEIHYNICSQANNLLDLSLPIPPAILLHPVFHNLLLPPAYVYHHHHASLHVFIPHVLTPSMTSFHTTPPQNARLRQIQVTAAHCQIDSQNKLTHFAVC